MSPTNPLLDDAGYIGDVPTGRPSYDPGDYPDPRPPDLDAEQADLDAASADASKPAGSGEGDDVDLSAYAVGGGWYEIDGERYQGKAKAQEALAARG